VQPKNYDIWVKKYGVKIANEKLVSFKHKVSKINSGSGNPMFGKPSPKGSGGGYGVPTKEIISELYDKGEIIFNKNSEIKFLKYGKK